MRQDWAGGGGRKASSAKTADIEPGGGKERASSLLFLPGLKARAPPRNSRDH